MTALNLLLVIVLGQTPAPTPSALIAKLGAGRYAERQAAATALEKLGRDALPALHAAREHKDAEVRSAAIAITAKIEGALLTLPTMITLDFKDVPLSELAKEIGERSGVRLSLLPENQQAWKATKVTLREPRPVPFWVAIDRLCDTARLQYRSGLGGLGTGREPTLALWPGMRPSGPISYSGPFRVSIVGLRHHRELVFNGVNRLRGPAIGFGEPPPPPIAVREPSPAGGGRSNGSITDQFMLHLQVEGEPRLSLANMKKMKLLEAVDDEGNSLVPPAQNSAPDYTVTSFPQMSVTPTLDVQTPLAHPPRLGGTIKRLKGQIPVAISTRKASPLVVPLAGAAGKTFQNDDVTVVVHELKINPLNRLTEIELTATSKDAQASPGMELVNARNQVNQQQVEFVDEKSQNVAWQISGYGPNASRIMLRITPQDPTKVATHLRYYGLTRTTADVDFEFQDIPMP
jgi:hypothetical protein